MGGFRPARVAENRTIIVLNATPIIYMCKCGLAGKLNRLKPRFRLITTHRVYDEVYTKGLLKAVDEVNALRELFDAGVIEVMSPKEDVESRIEENISSSGIHLGEASVIFLALELNGTAVIDDRRAKHVAKLLGARLSGTPGIIVELVRFRIISKKEATNAVERIIAEGWYCSPTVFVNIIDAIAKAWSLTRLTQRSVSQLRNPSKGN